MRYGNISLNFIDKSFQWSFLIHYVLNYIHDVHNCGGGYVVKKHVFFPKK